MKRKLRLNLRRVFGVFLSFLFLVTLTHWKIQEDSDNPYDTYDSRPALNVELHPVKAVRELAILPEKLPKVEALPDEVIEEEIEKPSKKDELKIFPMLEEEKAHEKKKKSHWTINHFKEINYTNIHLLNAPEFDPMYKNPCWVSTNAEPEKDKGIDEEGYEIDDNNYSDTANELNIVWSFPDKQNNGDDEKSPSENSAAPSFHCLPYFILAGFPKCGATDLLSRLATHPDIDTTKKGTHWWTRTRYTGTGLDSYLSTFQNSSIAIQASCNSTQGSDCYHQKITGEISVSLIWDNDNWHLLPGNKDKDEPELLNVHQMLHVNPQTRLIVILRDPIARLYSDYLSFSKDNNLSPASFHKRVNASVTLMEQCIAQRSTRACAYDKKFAQKFGVRLRIGMYSVYLNDWLSVMPRDQLHVISLESYANNTAKELTKVFTFLHLEPMSGTQLGTVASKPHVDKSHLYKNVGPMLPETEHILRKFYSPFMKDLSIILEDEHILPWDKNR